jgi:adenosylcobinamide-GDP ribazoletransferase
MHSLLIALAFLTIIPIRFRELPPASTVARSRWWFPFVGLLVGGLLGGWTALLAQLPNLAMLTAFLVLAAWVLLTGALHLDGFCDLCDGLFAGSTPEERLIILKEPYLGTFGLVGGFFVLLGKFVGLYTLLDKWPAQAPWLVGAAAVAARCLVLAMAAGARYPRSDGTGKVLVESTSDSEGVLNVVYAACVVVGLGGLVPTFDIAQRLALFLAIFVAVMMLRSVCERRLGGITGDCLGAGIEAAETVFLLTATLLASQSA